MSVLLEVGPADDVGPPDAGGCRFISFHTRRVIFGNGLVSNDLRAAKNRNRNDIGSSAGPSTPRKPAIAEDPRTIEDIVEMLPLPVAKKRGPYKKRTA